MEIKVEPFGIEKSDTALVYFPGFGDNEIPENRKLFLNRLATEAGLSGINLLRNNNFEIPMLWRENKAEMIMESCIEKLSKIDKNFIFLSNSLGANFALSAAEEFKDRTTKTLLITPSVGNLETVTKNTLRHRMGCDEARAQRVWDKFHRTNRDFFSLEGKDLSGAQSFFLPSDTIVKNPEIGSQDKMLRDTKVGHLDWEKSEELEAEIQAVLLN